MLEHPDITHVNRTGHTIDDWKRKTLALKSYMEDMYGQEIRKGDNYFMDENKNLVHYDNLVTYAIENNGLIKYRRD